jgi:hypothetical protein
MAAQLLRGALLSCAVAAAFCTPTAFAHAPTVDIVSPTSGVHYVPGFPVSVPLTLRLEHRNEQNDNCTMNAISNMKVTAQLGTDTAVTLYDANPTTGAGNTCPTDITFDWSVAAPGSYTLLVTTRHGNDYGTDQEENIEFLMLAVEYPAPPAVANAYINANPYYKSGSGKKRGCIISKIAEGHAKYEKYGDKGGPYDVYLIHSDVNELFGNGTCPVK